MRILKFDRSSTRALVRQSVNAHLIPRSQAASLERQVVRLIAKNIVSGRLARFADGRTKPHPLAFKDYVARVVTYVCAERARIQALEDGDPIEWNKLRGLLARRAGKMLQSFRGGADGAALDFADEACAIIFCKPYPFDVSFDAWATTILKNLIIGHFTRSADVLRQPRAPESLDAPSVTPEGNGLVLGDQVPNPHAHRAFEQVEDQTLLRAAIAQLQSDAQRELIRFIYRDDLSFQQVSKKMNLTLQATYNLHHRALTRLRRILTQKTPQEKRRHAH